MVGARLEGEASALLVRIFRRAAPTRKPNTEFLQRSEEHTSELQSQSNLVCRLLLEKKKNGRSSMMVDASVMVYLMFLNHLLSTLALSLACILCRSRHHLWSVASGNHCSTPRAV